MSIDTYLNPAGAPADPPSLDRMTAATRRLHLSIDAGMRRRGRPYLHPEGESIQTDLLGTERMVAWQEEKALLSFGGSGCWSDLPQVYGRYGTESTRELLRQVRGLENAAAAVVTESGMQACALVFDVLFQRGSHAVVGRGVYNKTRAYLSRLAERLGGSVSPVDEGSPSEIESVLREETCLVFLETYTNPLLRALDPARAVELVARGRTKSPSLRLVIDNTIATPWGLKAPLLDEGVDFVVASGTKALDGRDRNMWGYVASNDLLRLNEMMDLVAMRGGLLEGRRAKDIAAGLERARARFEKRCEGAAEVARFLSVHPRVSEVWHPSLSSHPDADVIGRHYRMSGSLLSFRVTETDEAATCHFCDVLAMSGVPRYALSFDGLATRINHHRTVSEYFTPEAEVKRLGVDRLVRLGVGIEPASDLIACLNWALWNYRKISREEVRGWRERRCRDLGIYR